jgi:hypothetical protein
MLKRYIDTTNFLCVSHQIIRVAPVILFMLDFEYDKTVSEGRIYLGYPYNIDNISAKQAL